MRKISSAAIALLFSFTPAFAQQDAPRIDGGDTAFMIIATALVLMMTLPGLALFSSGMVFLLETAKDNFDIILQVGAGTGLLYLVRWFWWRVNAWSEITAMVAPARISQRAVWRSTVSRVMPTRTRTTLVVSRTAAAEKTTSWSRSSAW